ncbi:2'-5' RNA ligase family protein [Nocardioides sp.]|uniref:2'-5' RNA ligase family protein n=1 Tax=Nocardioides sp. TaxID=35761 RepID=UPI00263822C3|nr:2'-5' RNA ligase family protein [Nocardioides sp.]
MSDVSAGVGAGAGHAVLAVPVPALDAPVRERTAFYDPSFVSTDPGFVHAHITLLSPWLAEPTAADLDVVAALAARTAPFAAVLDQVEEFVGGVIHLPPAPAGPFQALTAALVEAFPQCPPYAGVFPTPVPHLTLDHPAGGVTLAEVRERMHQHLPVTFPVDRIDLQWWANDDCRLLASWPLTGSLGTGRAR